MSMPASAPPASLPGPITSSMPTSSNPQRGTTQLLTLQDAAARLCMSDEWLRKKVQRREIPFIRLGRCVRFTEAHLAQIIAGGEQPIPSQPQRGTARTRL